MTKVPKLSDEDLSDRETLLLQLLREREECIQQLRDEIARLKGEKGQPKIKPSRLEPEKKAQAQQEGTEEEASEEEQAFEVASWLSQTTQNSFFAYSQDENYPAD